MEGRPARIDKAFINSFGFGGKNIVLALSCVDAVTEGQRVARPNWQMAYVWCGRRGSCAGAVWRN